MKILNLSIFVISVFLIGCNDAADNSTVTTDSAVLSPETMASDETNTQEEMFQFSAYYENEELKNKSMKSNLTEQNYMNVCEGPLDRVYQYLSLKTDKEYIEKLHYLYEATSQQDLDKRRASSFDLDVPGYGTAKWRDNKSKVQKIYNKYKNEIDVSINNNEKVELFETYSRDGDLKVATDGWLECIIITNGVPYLKKLPSSDSTLIVSFNLQPSIHNDTKDKVRVTNITFSDNLILTQGGEIKGKKITYSGTDHTLTFKRMDLEKATVLVSLEKGRIAPIVVPAIKKPIETPVYEFVTDQEIYQGNMDIKFKEGIIKITDLDGSSQEINFKPKTIKIGHFATAKLHQTQPLNFNIKTKLKNPDAFINDYYYVPITGGMKEFVKKGVKLENDGTISLDCYIKPGGYDMSGKFTILYSSTKKVCVKNCPQ